MPRIKPIESQINAPGAIQGRQATAQDFGAAAWEGVSRVGNSIQEGAAFLKKQEDKSAVSDQHAKTSAFQAEVSNLYDDTLAHAKPGDPKFRENFLAKYDEMASKLQEDASANSAGLEYFKTANATLRSHFDITAAKGQASLRGEADKNNFDVSLNTTSASVYKSPDLYEASRINQTTYLNGLSGLDPKLKLELQKKADKTLIAAKIRGTMDQPVTGPESAKRLLEQKEVVDLLGQEGIHDFKREIHQVESFNRTDANLKKAQAREDKRAAGDEAYTDYTRKIMLGQKFDPKEMYRDTRLDGNHLSSLQSKMEHMVNAPPVSNNAVYTELFMRINMPENYPDKPPVTDTDIFTAIGNGELAASGSGGKNGKELLSYIHGTRTQKGIDANAQRKALLKTAQTTWKDADPQVQAQFIDKIISTEEQYRNEGKDTAEIFDPKNTNGLYKFIVPVSPQDNVNWQLKKNGINVKGSNAQGKTSYFEEAGPKAVETLTARLTPPVQRYNELALKAGLGPESMFGQNGEQPKKIVNEIAIQAKDEVAEEQKQSALPGVLADREKQSMEAQRSRIKEMNKKFIEQQNHGLKALGLTPVAAEAPAPPTQKLGESRQAFIERVMRGGT